MLYYKHSPESEGEILQIAAAASGIMVRFQMFNRGTGFPIVLWSAFHADHHKTDVRR